MGPVPSVSADGSSHSSVVSGDNAWLLLALFLQGETEGAGDGLGADEGGGISGVGLGARVVVLMVAAGCSGAVYCDRSCRLFC